ncbi:hypothetical protein Ait01nite_089610 [Actinoplanes italicus]|uniref:Uncharacterized protein n=1 Tax=Actinoplanes italicus TaxID=113567 RepID=A0A2T0JIA9_9ACTN|nr:hypothetical protein [Actinoplanes italicus]PRX07377.1 hypothetical protein CLV67_14252 [Actinoplanes italicus]GIE35916.1 hypothetical protein Ait01nite_089610 [Actinoplanes italicus]
MTQLDCAIPTCRIPGQHQADCGQADCRGCLRRVPEDGWCCDSCVGHMHQLLGVITGLAPDARAVAAGMVRPGATRTGGSSNKPGSQSPGNDDATDALDEITKALAKIARDISTVRGLRGPQGHAEGRALPDPLARLCTWLSDQLTWVRHAVDDQGEPYAPTVHAAIRESASRIRAIVNGPGARRYLGPCGAVGTHPNPCCDMHNQHCEPPSELCCDQCTETAHTTFPIPHADGSRCVDTPCDGDVYGRPGATHATCRSCGHQVRQDERQVWIGDITRDRAYRAADIAHAHGIHVKTIRSWADRGKLTAWWKDGEQFHEWTEPDLDPQLTGDQLTARRAEIAAELKARGPRWFVLGDVLNLATADAARREQLRAEREQATQEASTAA